MSCDPQISRRSFVAAGALAVTVWAERARFAAAAGEALAKPEGRKICAFVKFLQKLSYDELADRIAELGFRGIEATVRAKGQIEPERVQDELPKLVEALRKRGLEITVMATDVNRIDQPFTERVLRTAGSLGIRCYRMAYYRYDLKQPILPQLEALKPVIRDLIALSRELDLSTVYQNHAGSDIVGAAVWDLAYLMHDYPPRDFGIAFDIRHATVEGGQIWPVHFQLMQPHLGAVFVKDFAWQGRQAKDVPLGEGQVDPKFFALLRAASFDGPISLHVEYLQEADSQTNLAAMKRDLATLRRLLEA